MDKRLLIVGVLVVLVLAGCKGGAGGRGVDENSGAGSIKSRDINRDVYIPVSTSLSKFDFDVNIQGYKNSDEDPFYNRVSEIILSIDSEQFLQKNPVLLQSI